MAALYDTHCHLGFAGNAVELAAAAAERGGALSATVEPAGFEADRAALVGLEPHVRVGLGLHPWWVADGRCGEAEIARFEELVPQAHFIAEVGLDFAPRRAGTEDVQRAAFERVCRAAAQSPLPRDEMRAQRKGAGHDDAHAESPAPWAAAAGRVLSLHAVRAADAVLDVLERTGCLDVCTCIFHWFSGTSDELQRAIGAGCLFSINERMLETKRGRAYARAIPQERLLLETDAPAHPVATYSPAAHEAQLRRTLEALALARGEAPETLGAIIAETSARILA